MTTTLAPTDHSPNTFGREAASKEEGSTHRAHWIPHGLPRSSPACALFSFRPLPVVGTASQRVNFALDLLRIAAYVLSDAAAAVLASSAAAAVVLASSAATAVVLASSAAAAAVLASSATVAPSAAPCIPTVALDATAHPCALIAVVVPHLRIFSRVTA
ncbi:hypothetical protein K438DRAFT_1960728 [Mycena galopus ATCC 62051]|nr:hypothetical protein K438DRAFT_1960728 [Mycena galopus ATCC 62051]